MNILTDLKELRDVFEKGNGAGNEYGYGFGYGHASGCGSGGGTSARDPFKKDPANGWGDGSGDSICYHLKNDITSQDLYKHLLLQRIFSTFVL